MQPGTEAQVPTRDRVVVAVLAGLVVAVLLERIVAGVARTGGLPSPVAQLLASDLAVWVPLGLAAVVAVRGSSLAAARRSFRVEPADVVVALGIVIVCRTVDAVLSLTFFGTTGLTPPPAVGGVDVTVLVVAAVGLCIVGPVVEEVVFRGLLQRHLARMLPPRTRFVAVPVTAALFAVLHVLVGSPSSDLAGFTVVVTTFLLGLLTGTLVAMTDRIGGAVLAHAVFNAVALVATMPR